MMDSDLAYVLLTEQQLHDREEELGRILTEEYADKRPIFLGILRGVVVFYADMVRRIPIPCDFDFMSVSSYEGSESTGRVKVQLDTRYDIRGRHVVILEDILDTGRTLHAVVQMLQLRQPARQAGAPAGRYLCRLDRLSDSQRVRGRLWSGLQ